MGYKISFFAFSGKSQIMISRRDKSSWPLHDQLLPYGAFWPQQKTHMLFTVVITKLFRELTYLLQIMKQKPFKEPQSCTDKFLFFNRFEKGGFGSSAGFVIYDETVADKRNGDTDDKEKEFEDKENMYVLNMVFPEIYTLPISALHFCQYLS